MGVHHGSRRHLNRKQSSLSFRSGRSTASSAHVGKNAKPSIAHSACRMAILRSSRFTHRFLSRSHPCRRVRVGLGLGVEQQQHNWTASAARAKAPFRPFDGIVYRRKYLNKLYRRNVFHLANDDGKQQGRISDIRPRIIAVSYRVQGRSLVSDCATGIPTRRQQFRWVEPGVIPASCVDVAARCCLDRMLRCRRESTLLDLASSVEFELQTKITQVLLSWHPPHSLS